MHPTRLLPAALALLLCGSACSPPQSPGTRTGYAPGQLIGQEWTVAQDLPAAVQAMRDAGIAEAHIQAILDAAQDEHMEASDLAPALWAIVDGHRANGPVGRLGGWMTDRIARDGLRGEPLLRFIQAHYGSYGYNHLYTPAPGAAPTFEGPGGEASTPALPMGETS